MTEQAKRRCVTYVNAATGLFTRTHRLLPGRDPAPRSGEEWIEGQFDKHSQWRNPATGQVEPLPQVQPIVSGNRIEGLPAGARVTVRGETFVATGGPVELVATANETVKVRVASHTHDDTAFNVALDPIASRPTARGAQVVAVRQDPMRLRAGRYQNEIGDGDTIDALCKSVAALLAANPAVRGPEVDEMKAILDRRAAIKVALPKPGGGQ